MRGHECQRGFTLIELMIVVALIAIISAIAIPNLLRARIAANEGSAIGSMRSIVTAQSLHKDEYGGYGDSLANLSADGSIDDLLGSGEKADYVFDVSTAEEGSKWITTAAPRRCGESGERSFYVNESGIIRQTMCPALANSTSAVLSEADAGNDMTAGASVDDDSFSRKFSTRLMALLPSEHRQKAAAILKSLRSATFGQLVLTRLDTDRDGVLSRAEILDADLLALARELSRGLQKRNGVAIAVSHDDALIEQAIRAAQHQLVYMMDDPVKPPPIDPADPAPHAKTKDAAASKAGSRGLSVEQLDRFKQRLEQTFAPARTSH
ncbi:MAG: prepilin-type N-terminal cleavage/methylation domain-containing protein [Deltaproteobacteria bacterium]|nr:prepilin-type N-terminal cleavage/methylation domain-containing protein [Deltaproteobacteria bacterium]